MHMDMPLVFVAMHKTPGDKNFYERWKAVGQVHYSLRTVRPDKINILVTCHRSGFDWKKLDSMASLSYVCVPNTGTEWVPKLPMGVQLIHLPLGCAMNHVTAVPQLALKMLLDLARPKEGIGTNLDGKSLLIWGYGRIGRTFGNYAAALGCKILPVDIGTPRSRRNEYLAQADYLSLHLPLTAATENTIDRRIFNKMKRGAFILNTARAGLIHEPDLISAIRDKHIAGAALDVCSSERLAILPGVIVYPHQGGYTLEDRIKTDEILVRLATQATQGKLSA